MKKQKSIKGKVKGCYFVHDAVSHLVIAKDMISIIRGLLFEDYEKYDPFALTDFCVNAIDKHMEKIDYVLEILTSECPEQKSIKKVA